MKGIISLIAFALIITGCKAETPKTPKTCYELRLEFNGVNSKQILCTTKPLKESYSFRKLDQ